MTDRGIYSYLKILASWRQKETPSQILRDPSTNRTAILLVREKNIPLYEIVVSMGMKVEFENVPVSFPFFIPFLSEEPTKGDNE